MRSGTLAIAGAVASAATLLATGTAAAAPATTIPRDGLYRVGIDITPGIYQSAGSSDPTHACYWQRLWKIAGPGDHLHPEAVGDPNQYIVASDITHTKPVRVMIKTTDVGFRAVNCGGWVMVPSPPDTGSYGPGGLFGSEY